MTNQKKKTKNKFVLIGWDAADWKIIYPLLAEGKMPALKSVMDRGVWGNLRTLNPPFSPVLWTSVATGKTPDKHGVLNFIEINPEKQQVHPVTVSNRKTRALWNIFTHQGIKSNIIGYWPSHPAEPINGCIVSDFFSKNTARKLTPEAVPVHSVYPESLKEEINRFCIHPDEIGAGCILPFVPRAQEIYGDAMKPLSALTKIIAQNSTVHACSTYLMEEKEWDFTAIYYDMIDKLCHGFMKYHPPKLPPVPQNMYDYYHGVVEGVYRFQDMMLEKTLSYCDEDTTVLIMSDHGFVSDNNRILKMPKISAAPALDHREFGIFVMAGPGIKKKEQIYGSTLLDICPTILHQMGLPIGEDMDGNVLEEIFEKPVTVNYVPSWDEIEGDFGEVNKRQNADPLSEQEAMQQLIELGYIDKPEEDVEKAINRTYKDIRFNLARYHMGNREYDIAHSILLEISDEEYNSSFLIDLLRCQVHLKDLKGARATLEKLKVKEGEKPKLVLLETELLLSEGRPKLAQTILNDLYKKHKVGGQVAYQIGKLYLRFENYIKAKECFLECISFQSDNAKYQHNLAKAYYYLGEYEEALDHGLTAVELIRYYPDAHYTLGLILDKLGDKENSVLAFETAKKLNPKHKKARAAYQKQSDVVSGKTASNWSEFITVVSGLPRSGTSMMMQALNAGGIEALSDGKRKSDENNPKGYFEIDEVKSLHKNNDILDQAQNKAVKIVAPLLKHIKPEFNYKVIFMLRDIDEIILSQKKMLGRENKATRMGLKESLQAEVKKAQTWAKHEPGVDILYLNYANVVSQPELEFKKISDFLNHKVDPKKMVGSVDKKLYRNRK